MKRKPFFDGKLYLESKHKSLLNPVLYKKAIYHFGVNFINILHAPFAPIFLCQKITNPKCN